MAEFVQRNIEDMIPELEQMERIGLFDSKETKQILKKRKAFEYRLQRMTKEKEDYMLYIQYETNLLALLELRRKETGYTVSKSDVDSAILHRILNLYRAAEMRFSEDEMIWLTHIEFSKQRKYKTDVSKVYTNMLKIHCQNPALWIAAAEWELETNEMVDNARNLFHRGLRFNEKSKELWIEYFKMELMYTEKLNEQFNVVGAQAAKKRKVQFNEAELEGKVATVVFKNAMTKFPDDVMFCLSFLPIALKFDVCESAQDFIYDFLEEHFPQNEQTQDARCRREYALEKVKIEKLTEIEIEQNMENICSRFLDIEKGCCDKYNSTVQEFDTDAMWTLYADFCVLCMNDDTVEDLELQTQRNEQLLRVIQACRGTHKLSVDAYSCWLKLLSYSQLSEDPVNEAFQHYPQCIELYHSYIEAILLDDDADDEEILEAFNQKLKTAKKNLSTEDYSALLTVVIQFCKLKKPQHAVTFLEEGIQLKGEHSSEFKILYLDWIHTTGTIKDVRSLYKRLSTFQPLSVEFFTRAIEIEREQPKISKKRIRSLHDTTLTLFGSHNTDVWIAYMSFESAEGEVKNVSNLHWKAMKEIDGTKIERFVTQYTLLQAGKL